MVGYEQLVSLSAGFLAFQFGSDGLPTVSTGILANQVSEWLAPSQLVSLSTGLLVKLLSEWLAPTIGKFVSWSILN